MMKNLFLTLTAVAAYLFAQAQVPALEVSAIPEAVKKDASVVKRYEKIFFEVTDIDRAYLKVHKIYTVMNEKGASELLFQRTSMGKFINLVDVNIKVYDANGKQVNKYKKKDLITVAYSDGLIDDHKNSYVRIPTASYPVTVEVEFEEKFKGSLFFPSYDIIVPGEGIQQSTFTARVPRNLDLRYKEQNIKLSPKQTEDDKYKTYEWSVSNLSPIYDEAGSVSFESRYPRIILAATRFKMDDYEGDMTSWKNLGIWYNDLHKGLDELPEERKAFFKDLVKHARDDREKVQLIYDYLQKNFRYVSIQLGIGGWKSLPAAFTDQKKYGDCKGLTNYMHAALKVVGVRSHPALINSKYNGEPVDPNFPRSAFNHVILCVPQAKDSIWLECTSKTMDFDVLGSATENRNALLITEEGGVLVATPTSRPADNRFDVTTQVSLQANGSGKTVSTFKTTGYFKEMIGYLMEEKKDDQKDFIINYLGFKQPDEFSLQRKETLRTVTADLQMSLEKVPEFIAGNKMFINPRLYKLDEGGLPKAENRKQDFYFHNPYHKTDTTILQLPEGFTVDALPQDRKLQCNLASYHTHYWFDDAKKAIYATTSLVLNQHRIPAAQYADVRKFFEEVSQDNAQRIVIRKQ